MPALNANIRALACMCICMSFLPEKGGTLHKTSLPLGDMHTNTPHLHHMVSERSLKGKGAARAMFVSFPWTS